MLHIWGLTRQGRKLLNYDLQILHDHIKSTKNGRIIVAFQDSEAFDSGLLAEVLLLFRYVQIQTVLGQ
jgi:origin recognition complex subunit 3